MTTQIIAGSTKVPLALNFGTLSVADAPGTLQVPTTPSVKEYRMPTGGAVIGLSSNLSGTLTTGTLTFYLTKNGTPITGGTFAAGTVNISTLGFYETDIAYQGPNTFAAGDTIGVGYSKAGTIAPTTRDLSALLIVLLDGYNY